MVQLTDVKWPAEYTELTRIEELLHCKICYEYIETSVITPCSHNYCSICIRKFLHYKSQCPTCFDNLYEKDLHANRVLDEFMESYLSLREKLLSCIKGVELYERIETPKIFTPSKLNTTKISRCLTNTPKKLFNDDVKSSQSTSSLTFTPKESSPNIQLVKTTPRKNIPGLSGNDKTPQTSHVFLAKSGERIINEIKTKKLPCPVCSIEISETYINRHLDDCLKRQRSMSPPKAAKNSLEPMPKYVLNLMKEGEVRKLLKKYGLSTSGARKAMEKRIQKFSTLYNAERDKLNPKSIQELVRLCEEEEIAEKNMVKQNSSDNMLNIDRKTDSSVIEKAHKQYLERNKEDYQKLIESIKGREKRAKRPFNVSRSLFSYETGGDNLATTSSASHSNQSFEYNDTNSSAADMSQYFIHDSDSTNTSYPLQHYSGDDPMRYLTLEISSESKDSPIKSEPLSPEENQTAMSSEVKSETPQGSGNDSDLIISANSYMSSIRTAGEVQALNNDIFDASTEDNWSDSYLRESRGKKSKKLLMKRTLKVEADCQSTDSETDVETKSFGYLGRKTKKIQRKEETRSKINAVNDNGFYQESPADSKTELSSPSDLRNKENSEIEDRSGTTVARRSSRRKNHVSYTVKSRGKKKKKKALDEVQQNFGEHNDADEGETSQDRRTKVKNNREQETGGDGTDQTVNSTLKSLRKRRKR